MIDMAQLDKDLRKVWHEPINKFYVIDTKTNEVVGVDLPHDMAIRICMKDFNNREIRK